jgi:uncharacterized membrane protein YdbT with pleckstrin-like domain
MALIEKDIDASDISHLYLNLHPGEEIHLAVRHHWAGFLPTFLLVAAMALFSILLLFALNISLEGGLAAYWLAVVIILSSYYVFLLTFLFGAWLNFYYDIVFITNQRVLNIAQEGLMARKTSELRLSRVQNVTAEVNGFFQTTLNYGVIVLETAGEGSGDSPLQAGHRGYFSIVDVPDPNRLARTILELHDEALQHSDD